MARLVYAAITSLDGYVSDEDGRFDWAEPDETVHRFINDLERDAGTYLFGRKLYETMLPWESESMSQGEPPYIQEYAAIWKAADKIVYSRTLDTASTARTRIEREFVPEVIRQMKVDLQHDILIGGPTLAANAMDAGLVDEYRLFVAPAVVGGGTPAFPRDFRAKLVLTDERRFGNGVVYLRYENGLA